MKYRLNGDGVVTDSSMSIPNSSGNRDWRKYLAWVDEGNTAYPADPGTFQKPVFDWNTGIWSEGETSQELTDRTTRNAARAKMRTDLKNGSPQSLPGLNETVDAMLKVMEAAGMTVDE